MTKSLKHPSSSSLYDNNEIFSVVYKQRALVSRPPPGSDLSQVSSMLLLLLLLPFLLDLLGARVSGKETTQECKPYESTFSEDCPPADWCIGCTVCDCDTHGNWNCHILSFCPDKNNKIKTTKKPLRKPRKPQTKNSAPKPTKTTIKNTKSTRSTKTTSRPNRPVKRQTNKVKDTVKQTHKASKYIKKNNKPSSKPLIIRKGKETKKPMVLKSTDNGYRLNDSDRELITKEVLKSVVTVMQKMLNNSQMINAQLLKVLPSPKSIQKRSNKRWRRNFTYTQKPPLPKPKNRRYKNKQLNTNRRGFTKEALKRSKRDVTVTEIYGERQIYKTIRADKQILSNNGTLLNATKHDDYFKYFVVTEKPYTDIAEQHTFRIINAENYNNKDENSVAEAVKTEKEFSIVAENLGYKPNISLSIENEIIGERYIPTEPISYLNEIKIHNDNIFTAIEINKTKLHTTEMNSTKNINNISQIPKNTFMRKMYETLNKFGTDQDKGAMSQVSYKNTKNVNRTTTEIEQFSRNIIENLRKLKNLAEMLNSRSRRKRNVMEDDDTIEYLLTLMEYMLKQTYPLDTAPVNDGIDLLIDAIKSAPDIKPIKKKVLQSSYKRISRTTEEIPHILSDDVSSDSSRNSKEDNITSVPSGTAEEVVGLTVGQYKDDQNGHKSIFDENTESVYYVRDFTTDSTTNLNQIVGSRPYVTENNSKEVQKDSNQFDKFENENGKKFEVYSADMDDDDSSAEITSTTAVPEKELEVKAMTTDVTIDTTELEKPIATPKINAKGKSRSSEGSDKPVSIDWLDDSYEQDIKENGTSSRTEATKIVSSSLKPILQKHGDVVSSMTKEYSDEHIKKEKAKWTAEKLMRQKQMDLLNSLDYGTERSEVEDADSKDDKDDTFSADYS
ncbi:unnamed protein product [Diatraea saccharalis]|uniref:Uncharacterized protein n=1 Tax=Diatraea saccharalis TaxID=40085 RepID=A0A9N9WJC3_9NEOP|nr:unnamed protein product [Diatraea saccharalis]